MRRIINKIKRLLPYQVKHGAKQLTQQLFRSLLTQGIQREIDLRIRKQIPIIIFQVGKVGSSSIYTSLRHAGLFAFHHHTLSPDHVSNAIDEIDPGDQSYQLRLRTGLWLYNNVITPGRPVKIITITRAPISAMVSAYFENLDRHSGIENAQDQFTMQELIDRFLENYVDSTIWYDWYDREFKRVTGIDIYDYPFDPAKGYSRIQERNYDVLLMRLEIPDEVKEQAIAEFLDLPGFKLENANVAQNKAYADVYSEFKRQVQIPSEILDQNYNSKHVRHFYTEEEIARFRAKWERTESVN